MKKMIPFIVLIFSTVSYGQSSLKATIIAVNDTIYYLMNDAASSKKIEKIIYCRKSPDYKAQSKEDNFMRGGIKPFFQIDSIKYFVYNYNWELVKEKVLKGSELKEDNNKDVVVYDIRKDFEVDQGILRIEGRSNAVQAGKINLKNNLPQDYFIRWTSNHNNIQFLEEEKMFLNRSKLSIDFKVTIEPGKHEYYITLQNSNNKSERIKIETIGYELLETDFVDKSKLSFSEEIVLRKDSAIYIEVLGNNKLLKIKDKHQEYNLSVSKVTNKVDKNSLKKGAYVFELHNLGRGEVRFCEIKIE